MKCEIDKAQMVWCEMETSSTLGKPVSENKYINETAGNGSTTTLPNLIHKPIHTEAFSIPCIYFDPNVRNQTRNAWHSRWNAELSTCVTNDHSTELMRFNFIHALRFISCCQKRICLVIIYNIRRNIFCCFDYFLMRFGLRGVRTYVNSDALLSITFSLELLLWAQK